MTLLQQMYAECDQPHSYILIHQTISIQDIHCKSDLWHSFRKKSRLLSFWAHPTQTMRQRDHPYVYARLTVWWPIVSASH